MLHKLLSIAALFGSLQTIMAESPPAKPGWVPKWNDEFDGTELDLTKWSYRYLGKRESAMLTKESISLDGKGHLLITVSEKDGVLQNGMIGTQGKFSATYGLFEARIQFPRMQGQHGSFWMQPDKGKKVADNPAESGVELDVIEWFGVGRKDGGTASNLYWPGAEGPKAHHAGGTKDFHYLLGKKDAEWSDDFHVYAVDWSPERYIFTIDGKETYRITEGISKVPQYLILSLFTADWEAARLDRTKLPNAMLVDWVRVWEKKVSLSSCIQSFP